MVSEQREIQPSQTPHPIVKTGGTTEAARVGASGPDRHVISKSNKPNHVVIGRKNTLATIQIEALRPLSESRHASLVRVNLMKSES
jgi:hypothetical protein